jgi:hypothetical protein
LSFDSRQVTLGRELASVDFVSTTSGELAHGAVCFTGPSGRPLRCTVEQGVPVQIAELPVGDWIAEDNAAVLTKEARRTVSCASGAGATAVIMVASWDGVERYFAWSNFGEWQELPLPTGLVTMAAPELVAGMDGRWHILYKDWLTDNIMCWSTK